MWELISFAQGKLRRICLRELSSGPKTARMIAQKSNTSPTHISRALRELQEKGLAVCRNPDLNKNRFYELTEDGLDLIGKLKDIEND